MHTYSRPLAPFVFPFHQELKNNCKIDVHGEVCNPKVSFFVDILSGPHSLLNIEFGFGDRPTITLQSCSSDIDTNEVVEISNPLNAGMKFHLDIAVRLTYYQVRLNGYTIALFPHRFPPNLAQCIAISKYVKVYSVNIEGFETLKDDVDGESSNGAYSRADLQTFVYAESGTKRVLLDQRGGRGGFVTSLRHRSDS